MDAPEHDDEIASLAEKLDWWRIDWEPRTNEYIPRRRRNRVGL